jgi:hypothetical protein
VVRSSGASVKRVLHWIVVPQVNQKTGEPLLCETETVPVPLRCLGTASLRNGNGSRSLAAPEKRKDGPGGGRTGLPGWKRSSVSRFPGTRRETENGPYENDKSACH